MKLSVCLFVAVLCVALPAVAQPPCGPGETNLLPNCAFPADVSMWAAGVGGGAIAWEAVDGAATIGSLLATSESGDVPQESSTSSDCFNVSSAAGMSVGYGAKFKASPRTGFMGAADTCAVRFETHTAMACGGASTSANGPNIFPVAVFQQSSGTTVLGASVISARIVLSCVTNFPTRGVQGAAPFAVLIDDTFVGPGLVPVELQSFSIE